MDIEEIKQLVQLMAENALSELDITDGDKTISLKRGVAHVPVVTAVQTAVPATTPLVPTVSPSAAPAGEKLLEVRSPMVGTFYAAPSPDSEPFAKSGALITDDSVVCIVEAMKVMNEIKAEVSGTITEVCVRNAQPVEYGQVLFRVRPS